MAFSSFVAELLVGILIGLTVGVCIFNGVSRNKATHDDNNLLFYAARLPYCRAKAQFRWRPRINNLILRSRPQERDIEEKTTNYTPIFNSNGAVLLGTGLYGKAVLQQAYPPMLRAIPVALPNHISTASPYTEAQHAASIWQKSDEQPDESIDVQELRLDVDEITAKDQHDEILYWNRKKKQEEQIAMRAAKIIAGGNVTHAAKQSTQAGRQERVVNNHHSTPNTTKEGKKNTPSRTHKRTRDASDETKKEPERVLCLVTNRRTREIGLSAPPKKKYKKARHPRARRTLWWLTT